MQNENFYIRTLKDKVTLSANDPNDPLSKAMAATAAGAAAGSVFPGVGNIIGAAVGFVGSFLSGIFSGGGHPSDSFVVGKMRALAEAAGFRNLTDSDIVHLLPGGWGDPAKIQNTAKVFVAQLQNIIKYAPGPYPQGIFGGGYQPNHAISFIQTTGGAGSGGSGGTQTAGGSGGTQTAGFNLGGMDLSTLLLVGAGIYFIADSKPKSSTPVGYRKTTSYKKIKPKKKRKK